MDICNLGFRGGLYKMALIPLQFCCLSPTVHVCTHPQMWSLMKSTLGRSTCPIPHLHTLEITLFYIVQPWGLHHCYRFLSKAVGVGGKRGENIWLPTTSRSHSSGSARFGRGMEALPILCECTRRGWHQAPYRHQAGHKIQGISYYFTASPKTLHRWHFQLAWWMGKYCLTIEISLITIPNIYLRMQLTSHEQIFTKIMYGITIPY